MHKLSARPFTLLTKKHLPLPLSSPIDFKWSKVGALCYGVYFHLNNFKQGTKLVELNKWEQNSRRQKGYRSNPSKTDLAFLFPPVHVSINLHKKLKKLRLICLWPQCSLFPFYCLIFFENILYWIVNVNEPNYIEKIMLMHFEDQALVVFDSRLRRYTFVDGCFIC